MRGQLLVFPHTCLPRDTQPQSGGPRAPPPRVPQQRLPCVTPAPPAMPLVAGLEGSRGLSSPHPHAPSPLAPVTPWSQPPRAEPPARRGDVWRGGGGSRRRGRSPAHLPPASGPGLLPGPLSSALSPPPSPCLLSLGSLLRASGSLLSRPPCVCACSLASHFPSELSSALEERRVSGS